MRHKGKRGIARLIAASKNSVDGLRYAISNEAAMRQELLLVIILLPVALLSEKSMVEILMLISGLFGLLITELLNTAIECTVDRISSEQHPLAKAAKDTASAAVLLSLIYCATVWIVIFFV